MARGRPVAPVVLSNTVRLELEAVTRSRWLSHALVRRARIILLAADGWSNTAIAAQVELSGATVGMWRKRIEEVFGWMKTVGGFRRTRYRGLRKVGWQATITAMAYNLLRVAKLCPQGAGGT